jgi:hypothetical protein
MRSVQLVEQIARPVVNTLGSEQTSLKATLQVAKDCCLGSGVGKALLEEVAGQEGYLAVVLRSRLVLLVIVVNIECSSLILS